MELIPAIDLLAGRAVRLAQGDFARVTDYAEPLAAAARWAGEGATLLHLVDLDGAREGRPTQAPLVRRIIASVAVACQVAGGLRDLAAVSSALAAGAHRVVLGSALLTSPALARSIVDAHGPDRLVAALDVRDGRVHGAGWLGPAGAPATEMAAALEEEGVAMFAVTAIARDGLQAGPDLGLLASIAAVVSPARVIASAGVTTLEDVRSLASLGYAGAILGRALYEGTLDLAEAMRATAGDADATQRG